MTTSSKSSAHSAGSRDSNCSTAALARPATGPCLSWDRLAPDNRAPPCAERCAAECASITPNNRCHPGAEGNVMLTHELTLERAQISATGNGARVEYLTMGSGLAVIVIPGTLSVAADLDIFFESAFQELQGAHDRATRPRAKQSARCCVLHGGGTRRCARSN